MCGFLQMLQISQGVSGHVISAYVLGERDPRPALLVVCSKGESSTVGETSLGIVSVPHLDRLFIQSLEQGLGLSPYDALEASLHPFSIRYELSRCLLMPQCFASVRDHPGWQVLGDPRCLLPCKI